MVSANDANTSQPFKKVREKLVSKNPKRNQKPEHDTTVPEAR